MGLRPASGILGYFRLLPPQPSLPPRGSDTTVGGILWSGRWRVMRTTGVSASLATLSRLAFPHPSMSLTPTGTGKLKIFLGMCPGVGKTFAMLQAAGELHRQGIDVIVGVVETHGRRETTALLDGLELLPRANVSHRGTTIEEMDLDALLRRAPATALVDELAHTNAPGSRHPKRWLDAAELLDAGIDVLTTINIQHLESRADVVAAITGVPVRETVPDSFLDRASEIELIDLPPRDLRRRLEDGKVYLGEQTDAAAANFFRESRLTALRQLALRYTAERVGLDLRDLRKQQREKKVWRAHEHLMVAVGPSPYSPSLIRRTRALAGGLGAEWSAVAVVTDQELSAHDQEALSSHLALARELGAATSLLEAADLVDGLLTAAHDRGATQIIIGKSRRPRLLGWLRRPPALRLLQQSGEIAVLAVEPAPGDASGEPAQTTAGPVARRDGPGPPDWQIVILTAGGLAVAGLLAFPYLDTGNIALLFLCGVIVAALFLRTSATVVLAILTGLLWNYLFTAPRFSLHIRTRQDLVTFGALTIAALAMGWLSSRLRRREQALSRQQNHHARLLEMTSCLTSAADTGDAVEKTLGILTAHLGIPCAARLRSEDDHSLLTPHPAGTLALDVRENGVAEWVFEHGQAAGRGTGTLPQVTALHLPLRGRSLVMGVLSAGIRSVTPPLTERDFLAAAAGQLGLALERNHLLRAVHHAEFIERSDQLRRTLLDHVSHELRTPVAVLGAAINALEQGASVGTVTPDMRDANKRLGRVVDQLVESARIEAGAIQPQPEWCDLQDLLEEAERRLGVAARDLHPLVCTVAAGTPPLVKIDAELLLAALGNLLANACQHTPDGTRIELSAGIDEERRLYLRVRDHGLGLEQPERLFDRFQRGRGARPGGLGLGLSIVRGVVRAMGGTVAARQVDDGGAEFTLSLPAPFATELPTDETGPCHAQDSDH